MYANGADRAATHWLVTAARLQAVTTTRGKPVLLRLDYEYGPGVGSTKRQALDERADVFAFMLWQMGVDAFQPTTLSADVCSRRRRTEIRTGVPPETSSRKTRIIRQVRQTVLCSHRGPR